MSCRISLATLLRKCLTYSTVDRICPLSVELHIACFRFPFPSILRASFWKQKVASFTFHDQESPQEILFVRIVIELFIKFHDILNNYTLSLLIFKLESLFDSLLIHFQIISSFRSLRLWIHMIKRDLDFQRVKDL